MVDYRDALNKQMAVCQKNLEAVSVAVALSEKLKVEMANIQKMNAGSLLKNASKMLVKGEVSLAALGLSPELPRYLEQYENIHAVMRDKFRTFNEAEQAVLQARLAEMEDDDNG